MPDSPSGTVTDNAALSRYELTVGDDVAFIDHVGEGDAVAFVHTKVPESMAGKGVGSRLVKGALEDARRRDLKVVPRCRAITRSRCASTSSRLGKRAP